MKSTIIRKGVVLMVMAAFLFQMGLIPQEASARWRDNSDQLPFEDKSDNITTILISAAAVVGVIGLGYLIVKGIKNKKKVSQEVGPPKGIPARNLNLSGVSKRDLNINFKATHLELVNLPKQMEDFSFQNAIPGNDGAFSAHYKWSVGDTGSWRISLPQVSSNLEFKKASRMGSLKLYDDQMVLHFSRENPFRSSYFFMLIGFQS